MTKKDVKLILIFSIVAILLLGGQQILTKFRSKSVDKAKVVYNNDVIMEFDIDKDATYLVEGSYGKMTIEVKDSMYHVIDVECPNHDCERVGWVKKGQVKPILCVPNNILIEQDAKY